MILKGEEFSVTAISESNNKGERWKQASLLAVEWEGSGKGERLSAKNPSVETDICDSLSTQSYFQRNQWIS